MAKRKRGVILDVDGTLVDSVDAHTRAWVDALAQAGHDVEYDRIREQIGKGSDKLLPAVAGIEKDSAEGKKLSTARAEIFMRDYLPHIEAFPHAHDLLARMRQAGLTLVTASSAKPEELEPLLKIAGADGLIEDRATAKEAKESKPDPDIVDAALTKIGCDAEEAVMLGDTPWDVEAANRAGVGAIALRCSGWSDEDLAGAIAIYDDPADLLAQFDQSPLAQPKNS